MLEHHYSQKLREAILTHTQGSFDKLQLHATQNQKSQCAEEKSNESVEDMDGTFAGW